MLDTMTEFGSRAERRLNEELIIWLTTVRENGAPQPSPVWFYWDGEGFLIYSRPDTPKLRNIGDNQKVALHLDSDGQGGDIVVIAGEARVLDDAPPADHARAYLEKYAAAIERIRMTPEGFASAFSVAIRVRPTNFRGH